MLANNSNDVQSGKLDLEIHLPSTAKLELVEFIAQELPRWREHPDRPQKQAETALTGHLCDHLNGVANRSTVWSHIQFRTETYDETNSSRTIDLVAKPCGCALIIEGRRHSQFDALFPIECKRLPTPNEQDRDKREYVFTEDKTTGGIQRFKFGFHGASHKFAAMIGFVQEQTFSHWLDQVNGWIRDLSKSKGHPWSELDSLRDLDDDVTNRVCKLNSQHQRINNLEPCDLRHLWINMN